MRHIYIDTNMMLNVVFNRVPDDHPSVILMRRCQQGHFTAYTSEWCVMTLMYMMDQLRDEKDRRVWTKQEIMKQTGKLISFVTMINGGNGVFAGAFAMEWADWEDAIIYAAADTHPLIEAIITNDAAFQRRTKKLPGIKAIGPAEVI